MNTTLAQLTRLVADRGPETDAGLLDRFIAGNEVAFGELVVRHGPMVFGVCNRILRHHHDSEDAFQAVFLVLARRAADVWPRDAVGAWLHGVAHRVAQKARGLRARRVLREQSLRDLPQPDAPSVEPDTAEIIDRVLRRLPQIYRAAVIACDLEGLSRRDAAGQLGWSEGTLSGRLARARKLLAERLRKAGVTLPAGGLAAALGADNPVRASLSEKLIELATGIGAAQTPASVAVLAKGVVPSMLTVKLQTVAAVAMVLVIGLGAWAAGSGNGPEGETRTRNTAKLQAASEPNQLPAGAASPKMPPALEPLQGRWRVLNISEGDKAVVPDKAGLGEVEIAGTKLAMPYREAGGARKRQEFRIAADNSTLPKTIDLIAPGRPVGKGIYEITASATMCATCHKMEHLGFLNDLDLRGLCQPAYEDLNTQLAARQRNPRIGLRLAIATSGARPTKFGSGADGIIEFNLERIDQDDVAKLEQERDRLERSLNSLPVQGEQARSERERVTAKLAVVQRKLQQESARKQLMFAQANLEQARATVAAAQAQLDRATSQVKEAEKRVEAIEKGAGKPLAQRDAGTFTIHIRPIAGQEIMYWVETERIRSVLEGLALSGGDLPIKPESVHVWVVRDKAVLPVDLEAIMRKRDSRTNYTMKNGDQLFVQEKVAK